MVMINARELTTLPLQETKRLKLGNDLATVISLSVKKIIHIWFASENVQQAHAPVKVPESTEEFLF